MIYVTGGQYMIYMKYYYWIFYFLFLIKNYFFIFNKHIFTNIQNYLAGTEYESYIYIETWQQGWILTHEFNQNLVECLMIFR